MEVVYQSQAWEEILDPSLLIGKTIVNITKDVRQYPGNHSWTNGIVIHLNDRAKLVISYEDHEGGEFHIIK